MFFNTNPTVLFVQKNIMYCKLEKGLIIVRGQVGCVNAKKIN